MFAAAGGAAVAADGDFDFTFDNDGIVTTSFGSEGAGARSVAIQTDGKIVVAGDAYDPSTSPWGRDFALARYNTDGSLDGSFDGDGKVTTSFGPQDLAVGVAIQTDGKIVVAGSSDYDDFALARYNTDGSLDGSFDGDGKVTTSSAGQATGVAIQADGRIVVVGTARSSSAQPDFALARYNSDGSLDTTFDTDGKLTTSIGEEDLATGVAIQADGRIVAVGGTRSSGPDYGDFALARYNTDGSLDSTFDTDGKLTTRLLLGGSAAAVAIQSDGRIVAVGTIVQPVDFDDHFGIVRYTTEGSLDSSFGIGGKVMDRVGMAFGMARGVSIQSDGKIVVVGETCCRFLDSESGGWESALVRYNADGSRDTTFGEAGVMQTTIGNAAATAIQANGRIITVGRTYSSWEFFVARYLSQQPACTITGTALSDTIVGTSGDDVICGLEGSDVIRGLEGDDFLFGGSGNDRLIGGDGNDTMMGDTGADELLGGLDADTLDAVDGTRTDKIRGGHLPTNAIDTCTADAREVVVGCEA